MYCVRTLTRSTEPVRTIGFSYDGKYIAFGSTVVDEPCIDIVRTLLLQYIIASYKSILIDRRNDGRTNV